MSRPGSAPRVQCHGYGGGVDSAYLATIAWRQWGRPPSSRSSVGARLSESQWTAARAVAERIGLAIVEIETDELNDPRYAANPTNRCYYCKAELWSRLVPGRGGSRCNSRRRWNERGRPSRSSTWSKGGAGARRTLAPRDVRVLQGGHPRAVEGARLADLATALIALSVVPHTVWHAGDCGPTASGGASGGRVALAGNCRRFARATLR